jgi:hypothetical protein
LNVWLDHTSDVCSWLLFQFTQHLFTFLKGHKYRVQAYDSVVTVVEPAFSIFDIKLCVSPYHCVLHRLTYLLSPAFLLTSSFLAYLVALAILPTLVTSLKTSRSRRRPLLRLSPPRLELLPLPVPVVTKRNGFPSTISGRRKALVVLQVVTKLAQARPVALRARGERGGSKS